MRALLAVQPVMINDKHSFEVRPESPSPSRAPFHTECCSVGGPNLRSAVTRPQIIPLLLSSQQRLHDRHSLNACLVLKPWLLHVHAVCSCTGMTS